MAEDEVIFRTNRNRVLRMVVTSGAFVAAGLWLLSLDVDIAASSYGRYQQLAIWMAGLIATVFFGFTGLYGLMKILDAAPGLILNKSGMTDNSGPASVGFVPWSDITGFSHIDHGRQRLVLVLVKNSDAYLANRNLIQWWAKRANIKKGGTPVTISAHYLDTDHKILLATLEGYRQRYGERG